MVQLPPRPVLTWQQIAATAKDFSDKYRLAERDFPLDVEEIAEFDLDIEIRVAYGILEECGTPAQIAHGESRPVISVDANQYRQQTSFYRYSVAHEIGHYVLHRNWLEKVYQLFDSIESWKQIIASLPDSDYEWIEGQAEEFASYLLAPEQVFEPFLASQLSRVAKLEMQLQSEDILPYLANPTGYHFGMSNSAAQARIRKSGQWKKFVEKINGTDKKLR